MSENNNPPVVEKSSKSADESILIAKIVYGLYIASVIIPGLTGLIGVIMAYIYYGDGPEWLDTHFKYQIRSFWIYCCYFSVSLILTMFLIGFPLLLLTSVWSVIRAAKGLKSALKSEPIYNVETWWV